MEHFLALFISGITSFFTHHFGDKFFAKRKRNIKLVLRGYHIHHSTWGLIAILGALISAGSMMFMLLGYGIGNIWQHKRAHNNAAEKGMVFITKHKALEKEPASELIQNA